MSYQTEVREVIDSVSDGSSLLVSGPPMTGKYDLLVRLLSGGDAIAITTSTSATTLREDHGASSPQGRLSIIDCVSHARGLETTDSKATRYVPGPGNLTRIGTAFTALIEDHSDSDVRVGLHSISPLLMQSELRSVYRFLQVLTGQVEAAGWLCFATFDPTMHDEQTVSSVLDPFDGVIETREQGRREARIKGLDPTPGEWAPF